MINNTDKAYQDLLKRILSEGKEKGDRTGTGTISIFSHTLEMDMADGFPLLTTKKMFTKGIIHELLWFLNGDTNIKYLVDNGVNIWTPDAFREYYDKSHSFKGDWPDDIESFKERIKSDDKFAEKWGELGPVYGKQWVNCGNNDSKALPWSQSINQIQNAIDALNNNPDSRRIMVSAWNVGEIDQMALPPCHWAFELYTEELTNTEREKIAEEMNPMWFMDQQFGGDDILTRNNIPTRRLHLKWHQRSVDTFLGLPFNIASYALLLHMFAQQTNMVPSTLIGDLTNVHIYKNHIEQVKEQIGRKYSREERIKMYEDIHCSGIGVWDIGDWMDSNLKDIPTHTREPMKLPTLELEKADDIFSYCYENVKINDYYSHPTIKGEISV